MKCNPAKKSIAIIAAAAALASGTIYAQRSNEDQRSGTKPSTAMQSEQPEKTARDKGAERKETPPPRRESRQADCKGPAQLCKQDSAR